MQRYKLDPQTPDKRILEKAAEHLMRESVLCHATETVYGLAAAWQSWKAIQLVGTIKRRSLELPYSIMVDSIDEILGIAGWHGDQRLREFLEAVFPGPVTIIIARRRELSLPYWNQFSEIGFRLPDHVVSRALIRCAGSPIITTSANLAGEPPPVSAKDVSSGVKAVLPMLLDSGPCQFETPSTVIKIDADQPSFTILRQGAFEADRFSEIFHTFF